jgi:hypothetical protein
MQMQIMANDPAFFGLYGIEPYRSNYVDEEILNVMAKLLGHYAIEGNTTPFLTDPYELKHIANPDFADGLTSWTVSPAEVNSIIAGNYTGYGNLQGRYPGNNAINNTFAIMTRSAGAPNSLGQQIQGLQNGRLYSLKLITGDYKNLTGNVSSNAAQVLKITVDNGASDLVVATPARFSQKFKSWFTVNGFNSTHPYWMTYHWLQFRATGPTAQLTIKDWQSDTTPGGPAAQQVMVNFVEIQPVLEEQIQSLETWLAYRGVPEADRGPLADPNGDGMPNLLAYALNIHPLQGIKVPGGNASPQYSIYQLNGTNYLALDYRVNRYATGINVQVELSQTLAQNSWAVPGTLVITPNGTDPVTKDQLFRATVELSGLPRAFLRLNVSTQNP